MLCRTPGTGSEMPVSLLRDLRAELAHVGLNLIGAAAPAEYDALVPERYRIGPSSAWSRGVIVIGNGGGAFWRAYRGHVARRPGFEARAHPLDDFTTCVMEETVLPIAARLGVRTALRLPFDTCDPPISFVHLAEAAGLGRRSLVGVLVHPEFGPWIALRGALLVDVAVQAPRPAAGFDPCPACVARPCIAACLGAAVGDVTGWDVPRCISHRREHADDCVDRCHARLACVYGRQSRYPSDELAYHQRRAFEAMVAASEVRRSGPGLVG